jgi:hypothetical protein
MDVGIGDDDIDDWSLLDDDDDDDCESNAITLFSNTLTVLVFLECVIIELSVGCVLIEHTSFDTKHVLLVPTLRLALVVTPPKGATQCHMQFPKRAAWICNTVLDACAFLQSKVA